MSGHRAPQPWDHRADLRGAVPDDAPHSDDDVEESSDGEGDGAGPPPLPRVLINRHKLTPDDAKAIWTAAQNHGTKGALIVGQSLGYGHSSVYKAINLGGEVPAKYRSPTRSKIWNNDQINALITHIETNPTKTLDELLAWAKNQGFPDIGKSTLNGYLGLELITYKSVTNHNQQRNCPENLDARADYAQWFLEHQDNTFIYLDEFGFNLSTQRHYGQARTGVPAIQITPANQGTNVSVAMAIQRGHGIVHYEVQHQAFKITTFTAFVDRLLNHFAGATDVCFVMDNCRIHDREGLPGRVEEAGCTMKFLPPYSPMLNPIEEVIGDVKREIKRLLSVDMHPEALRIQSLRWGEKAAARRDLLERALLQAISTITAHTVDQHFGHSYSFLTAALERREL